MTAVAPVRLGGPLLEVAEVHAGYGQGLILQRLSLHVDDGEVVSVIGPNSAPKQVACASPAKRATAGRPTRS